MRKMLAIPDCPHCDTAQKPDRIAVTVNQKEGWVIDTYVCQCCTRTFDVTSTDPEDDRLMHERRIR